MEAVAPHELVFFQGAIPASFITGLIQSGAGDAVGATGIFLGKVRADILQDQTVASISFTAYENMAIEKMREMSKGLFEKYPISCLTVGHSLGEVAVGGVCLCVFTASEHRKAALEACNETVERVKNELPIWGRENFSGSGYQWKINPAP